MLAKDRNIGQKSKFWSKTELLLKQSRILLKNQNFGLKIEILVKNQNFGQKSKYFSKIKNLRQKIKFSNSSLRHWLCLIIPLNAF